VSAENRIKPILMPTKIKALFAVLALIALISVFYAFRGLGGNLKLSLTPANVGNSAFGDNETDHDHDGLLDIDESIWNTNSQNKDSDGDGFLDGEEIASGRDPRVPGPDDLLFNSNMTDKIAELAVGGLIEGSLKPGNSNFENNADTVALSVIDESLADFETPVNYSKLQILDNSPENTKSYLTAIIPVWTDFFKTIAEQSRTMDTKLVNIDEGKSGEASFISYFNSYTDKYNLIAQRWQAVPVPAEWKEKHLVFLEIFYRLTKINYALSLAGEDPLKAYLAINIFIQTIEDVAFASDQYSNTK
jgi:hypothetical protein